MPLRLCSRGLCIGKAAFSELMPFCTFTKHSEAPAVCLFA